MRRPSVSSRPSSSLYVFSAYLRCYPFAHRSLLQDEHGEVCPANWQAGSKTIKADPKGSLEYFSNASEANSNVSKKRRLD